MAEPVRVPGGAMGALKILLLRYFSAQEPPWKLSKSCSRCSQGHFSAYRLAKLPQEAAKKLPRHPQETPRARQEPQEAAKRPQEAAKTSPRGRQETQGARQEPQEAAKRLPRCPMMPPRGFQEASKRP